LPLKIIVAKNYRQFVEEEFEKDVVMYFWVPDCAKCQKLSRVWEKLANELAEVDNLTIGKLNAKTNEVRGLKIGGYPTIMIIPKGKQSRMINYDA
jgi:thioredoxin-like negative regulator of GroEL